MEEMGRCEGCGAPVLASQLRHDRCAACVGGLSNQATKSVLDVFERDARLLEVDARRGITWVTPDRVELACQRIRSLVGNLRKAWGMDT